MDEYPVPVVAFPDAFAAVQPISFPATASGALVLNRGAVLAGWSVADAAAGGGGRAELYDGPDGNAELVDTIVVAAAGADRVWFALPGLALTQGAYVKVVSGTLHGVVYVRP